MISAAASAAATRSAAPEEPNADSASPAVITAINDAQLLFYNGRYEDAAALTLELCAPGSGDLNGCELRTSTLLFQIKRAIGDAANKEQAWKACAACPALMTAFLSDISRGQTMARARLQRDPGDQEAIFLLGKLDLNYVWLQLGTLGKKTGWREYWEARKSLDRVLADNPGHVRARVARAWIDYIVDTRMPRGSRWILGGGSKKRGLRTVREAAVQDTDFYAQAEAGFALWDMQVREKDFAGAVVTARDLARDFPENKELTKFIETHAGR